MGEILVSVEIILLLDIDFCVFGVYAKHFETGLPIIEVKLLSHELQRPLPVFLSLIDFSAFLLHVSKFEVAACILLIFANFIKIVIFGLIELTGH